MSAIKEESESIKHGVFIKHELPDVGEFTAEQYKVQNMKQETTHVSILEAFFLCFNKSSCSEKLISNLKIICFETK